VRDGRFVHGEISSGKRCHDGVLIIGEVVHKQSEHI
jgi:hypothetical protein